jgi:hypothetical protein
MDASFDYKNVKSLPLARKFGVLIVVSRRLYDIGFSEIITCAIII